MLILESLPKGDFWRDVQVQPDVARAHVFHGRVEPAWIFTFASGGVLMALGMRAAERDLGRDDLVALSAHATFCAPVSQGPVEITVRVLRSGKTAAQVLAELSVPGQDSVAMVLTATFGQLRADSPFTFDRRVFPTDVPPYTELPPTLVPEHLIPLFAGNSAFGQYEHRRAVGHAGWESGWTAGTGRYCGWLRFHSSPMRPDGTLDPLCLAFAGDQPGIPLVQALGSALGMNLMAPTLNLDLQFIRPTTSEWLCVDVSAHEAIDGFAHVTAEIWDQERRMVGLCSQRAALKLWTK